MSDNKPTVHATVDELRDTENRLFKHLRESEHKTREAITTGFEKIINKMDVQEKDSITRLEAESKERIKGDAALAEMVRPNPANTRWIIGMAWVVSVVVVGWGSKLTTNSTVNASNINSLQVAQEKTNQKVETHQSDGHPYRVEAKTERNERDIAAICDLLEDLLRSQRENE